MQFTPWVIPLLLSGAVNIGLAYYSRRFRDVPGARPFIAATLAAALWAFAYALDISSSTLAGKYVSIYLRFPALAFLPATWAIVALEHTGRGAWLTRRRFLALLVVPLLTSLMAWTSSFHGLLRTLLRIDMGGPFPVVIFRNGPWYWVHVAWGYSLLVITIALLAVSLRGAAPFRRRQAWLMICAILIAVVPDVLFNAGVTPLKGFNLASMMTLPGTVLLAWALFRHRLWSAATLARGAVVQQMQELMLVVDERGRLADFNSAAAMTFGLRAPEVVGRPAEAVLQRWPDLLAQISVAGPAGGEWSTQFGGRQQTYHLSVTPLENQVGIPAGRLILLGDITERKRAEEELRQSEERFRLMVDHIPLPIVLTRMADSAILYANPQTTEILGLCAADVAGKPALDFYANPADRDAVMAELRRAGSLHGYEMQLRRGNGEPFWAIVAAVVTRLNGDPVLLVGVNDISERKRADAERERLIGELQEALTKVKLLSGLLPICASCKRIRNDEGYWQQIEVYLRDHSDAEFSHGLCPDCIRKLYPDFADAGQDESDQGRRQTQ